MKNKVSIIVPIYNVEKYLSKTLDSLIKQTYENIEIILIDDGSTDNSRKIIEKYAGQYTNIKYFYQKNMGAPAARNKGIEMCSGNYILFFDSDDLLEKNAVELLIKDIDDYDMVIGNFIYIDDDENKISKTHLNSELLINEKIFEKAIFLDPVPSNKLYNAKIIKDNNIVFANVKIAQDLNFYLKYIMYIKSIKIIDDDIFKYRLTPNSISRTYSFKIFDIVNSFNDVKNEYQKNNKWDIYEKYLVNAELEHYSAQMNKMFNFEKKDDRNKIFDYFKEKIMEIDFSKCVINYSKKLSKMKLKFLFKRIYISDFYKKIYLSKH